MNIAPINSANQVSKQPSFNGSSKTFTNMAIGATKLSKYASDKYDKHIVSPIAKHLVAPLINKFANGNLIDKTSKIEGLTQHMSIAGSFVTTGTYMGTTLNNKNLEKKPARTLALNQGLVAIISTIGALTINSKIANATKEFTHKFSNANQSLKKPVLAKRMAGLKAAQQLLTFTLMYRYISPVIVTPVASTISKALTNHKAVKPENKVENKK